VQLCTVKHWTPFCFYLFGGPCRRGVLPTHSLYKMATIGNMPYFCCFLSYTRKPFVGLERTPEMAVLL
jgi:hypothetical protein